MDANKYQELAMRTAGDTLHDKDDGKIIAALGLTGAAGEFAEIVKKWKYHNHPFDRDKAIKEAGDICWYIARACVAMDISLSEVMEMNIEKLKQRYPEGFTTEASMHRIEYKTTE
jgi:NTP pyrophosphatase (non-canonical NTP hydrolase)